jgi:dTDP-4-amino-4,6-dideoxygalactose transaminase
MSSTQLFVPYFRVDECLEQIRECLVKGWTGLGFKTVEFEKAWGAYTGLPHSHFLSSNTVGLHLALHIFRSKLGWAEGDEVITTPLTFVSSNHAILYEKPHAGVRRRRRLALPRSRQDIERKITPRTRAVMFVGIGGNVGRYAEVVELCRRRGLTLILDAAHMAGTRVGGKHVGADADCAVFSFQAVKNLPTADSGMICFREADDDARARRWHGSGSTRTPTRARPRRARTSGCTTWRKSASSTTATPSWLPSARSLKYLDQDNAYRRQLAKWYSDELAGSSSVRVVEHSPQCESSRHLFQVRVKNRDAMMVALNEAQVFPGVHYRDNTVYPMYAHGRGKCPNAALASAEILSLPMHMSVSREEVAHIAAVLKKNAE